MRMKYLVAGLLLILAAGPAYPQNKDILRLQSDMITLQQQVKQLQSSVDENNNAIKGLVEKIADQVNTLAGSLPKVNQTLDQAIAVMRTQNETTAKEMRTILSNLNTAVGELQEGLTSVRAQINTLSQQVTAMKTTAEPLAGPNDLWRTAMSDLLVGNYDLALGGFSDFVSKYPNDARAAEAHLRIADAQYGLKKYEQAETEYDFVLQKYPESDTTRAALLKKGLALAEHDKPQAIATLTDVVKKFPNTAEANTAQGKLKELQSGRRPPAR
jgi:tol-pal system protein YbgF